MAAELKRVPIADIQAAQTRIKGLAIRSPLLACDAAPAGIELHLKLENLQPINSFKVRPIGNAVMSRPRSELEQGIYTSSSGNSALAVAWMAKRLGIPAAALVPENAPVAKLERLAALGARIVKLSFEDWWRTIEIAGHPDEKGVYIDAVRDPASLAGDGTIGIEILEDLAELDAIFVPFGGGGLACGIACAVRALRPEVKIIACELDTAHPVGSSLQAGKMVEVPHEAGFVSGVGYGSLLPEMWPLIHEMIDGTIAVSLHDVAAAIKVMAETNKVIAEGAGAVPVAAALFGHYDFKKVCAVVSGGNLGSDMLTTILAGGTPG